MEASQILASVTSIHEEARRRGLFFQTCEDEALRGRLIRMGGRDLVSFSSCSYLGLEQHPAVIAGVHDAVDRYGVQFSCSRGYVSAPIYGELEEMLGTLFGAPTLVTPSTTMAHLVALPVLATEKDAVVLDHQAHHSLHIGANQARAQGAAVELVRHDELARACDVVRRLAARHRTVWFCTDGVFSMYGDLAPLRVLEEILAVAPNVRLYVDDAHGMSWAGQHGRGSFLSRFPMSERIVVATSFAKGFGAGGGCLVFPTVEERERVRLSGGPLVFSGPMQPPMMGAVKASARIHLSPEIEGLQRALFERTEHVNTRLIGAGLTPIAVNGSPIFFLLCGLPRVAFRVAERMAEDGVYVNCSVYPTVPMKRAGIRFTITSAHSYAELDHAIDRLAVHVPAAIAEEGLDAAALASLFRDALPAESAGRPTRAATLTVESASTIAEVDPGTWNAVLGTSAVCSWDAMRAVEAVYGRDDGPVEQRWTFRYVLVRDADGKVVAATVLTTLLQKDDMTSREEVSREVEARRLTDPYFLTSRVVMFGTNVSEGNHLYVDRRGPWREALRAILAVANEELERAGAAAIVVRDLPQGDPEMDAFMLENGLTRLPMLDTHVVDVDWADEEAFLAALPKRKRRQLKPILEQAEAFEVRIHGHGASPLPTADAARLYAMYLQLAARKLRLNTFPFPPDLFAEILDNPAWEVGVLRLPASAGGPPDGRPVAFWAAYKHDGHYAPLFCGMEDAWSESHGAYRAALWNVLRRAHATGMRTVHFGMDAEIEKRRFGARAVRTCVYAQVRDHYAGAILRDLAAEVALRDPDAQAAK
ncbi:MAG: aminotransferase class I/II-fold pyridoxal phosphate-dependent enzyme [Myxococcota bacterium]